MEETWHTIKITPEITVSLELLVVMKPEPIFWK